MKGNVNPFEPWRPAELEVPPPLHAARPWRPAAKKPVCNAEEVYSLLEPIEEALPPADKPRKRPDEPKRRRRAPEPSVLNTPVEELRTDQKIVLGMIFVLGTLGLAGLGWLGGTHAPRVATALLAVAAGFTVGVSVARRRGWSVRLGWMAAGLALAGLAGWFVPTTGGVNLWSAYRQVDELRVLPAGDVAGYVRGLAERKELVSEFPAFAEDVADAERAWVRRAADTVIEDADRLLETDPHKALSDLQKANAALVPLEHYPLVRGELESALRRARQACR